MIEQVNQVLKLIDQRFKFYKMNYTLIILNYRIAIAFIFYL